MAEKVLTCFLAGWLCLIYVIRIYKRDEKIRKRGSKKMSWYEYLMSLGIDELGEFLANSDDVALLFCNESFCPYYVNKLCCPMFEKYKDGDKADEYPCVKACVNWLNSEREGK